MPEIGIDEILSYIKEQVEKQTPAKGEISESILFFDWDDNNYVSVGISETAAIVVSYINHSDFYQPNVMFLYLTNQESLDQSIQKTVEFYNRFYAPEDWVI